MTSPAALAFLEDAVGHVADDGGAHRHISLSQAELARRCGRSPGTVAYYLAQAGTAVVTRGWGGVVVDVAELEAARARLGGRRRRCHDVADAMAQRWGTADHGVVGLELTTSSGRAPTVSDVARHLNVARSTAQRHLSDLDARGLLRRRGGRLFLQIGASGRSAAPQSPSGPSGPSGDLATPDAGPEAPIGPSTNTAAAELAGQLLESALRLAQLAERLLAGGVAGVEGLEANPRTDARNPREDGAQIAEVRERTEALAGSVSLKSTEKERKLPSLPEVREPLRAEPRGLVTSTADQADPAGVTDDEMDELIEPLAAACHEHGFRDFVDDHGRDLLRPYSVAQLAHAVAHVHQRVREGAKGLTNPLGILVAGAQRGDRGMFSPPPEPVLDTEAPSLVSARSHARLLASLDDLDDEGRRSLLIAGCKGDQAAIDAGLSALATAGCAASAEGIAAVGGP